MFTPKLYYSFQRTVVCWEIDHTSVVSLMGIPLMNYPFTDLTLAATDFVDFIAESFVSLFTPDIYQYNFVPEISMGNKTFLTFMVKAKCDAHVALSATYGELHKKTIEILIGTEGNTKSLIKDGVEGSVRAEALTANVLSGNVSCQC